MNDPDTGPVFAKNGKLYSAKQPDKEVAIENVISADGWNTTLKLITANQSMPGPPIFLYENQKITIIVQNNLLNEAITIHWHGIDQLGWPAMDGVAFVTQCPILPGQYFNYTFNPVLVERIGIILMLAINEIWDYLGRLLFLNTTKLFQ